MSAKETPRRLEYWINLKNKTRYRILGLGTDATNDRAGLPVVIYYYYGKGKHIHVRELEEFIQKFYKEA